MEVAENATNIPQSGANASCSAPVGIVDVIAGYFVAENLNFKRIDRPDGAEFTGVLDGFDGEISAFAFTVIVGESDALSYAKFPRRIPTEREGDMLKLVVLLNLRVRQGHFDYDSGSGVVYFRMAKLASELRCADRDGMRMFVELPAAMLHRFVPAFDAVIAGTKNPEAAINDCL